MRRETFIVVPADLTDPQALNTFLSALVEQLDIAFGNRSESPFTTTSLSDPQATGNYIEQQQQTDTSLAAVNNRLDSVAEVTALPISAQAASAVYVDAELQQVISDISAVSETVNSILAAIKPT